MKIQKTKKQLRENMTLENQISIIFPTTQEFLNKTLRAAFLLEKKKIARVT